MVVSTDDVGVFALPLLSVSAGKAVYSSLYSEWCTVRPPFSRAARGAAVAVCNWWPPVDHTGKNLGRVRAVA